MMEQQDRDMGRREFFRWMGRGAAVAGLAAVAAVLALRRQTRLPGQTCINDGLCAGCRALGDCRLPRAQIVKRQKARG